MSETKRPYWLLSETSGIGETRDPRLQRHMPLLEGFHWLEAGWRDFWVQPGPSLAYGIIMFVLSIAFVWTLVAFGRDYILFPALAGFMIVAPFLAIGLYEKSRAIEEGRRISFGSMLLVRPTNQSFHLARVNDDECVSEITSIEQTDLWVNGGFFILRPEIFRHIKDGEELVQEPFIRLTQQQRLLGYRHSGFWCCMDTFKDKKLLDDMYNRGDRPWEVWRRPRVGD